MKRILCEPWTSLKYTHVHTHSRTHINTNGHSHLSQLTHSLTLRKITNYPLKDQHTHKHSHTHVLSKHTCKYTPSLSCIITNSHTLAQNGTLLFLTISFPLTSHTLMHVPILSLSFSLSSQFPSLLHEFSLTLTQILTHTHTHTVTPTRTHSLAPFHTHIFTHTQSLVRAHTSQVFYETKKKFSFSESTSSDE